jgi:CHRD domain-containing protein
MKTSITISGVVAAALLTMVVAPLANDGRDERRVSTRLSPYEETPLTINSTASGDFKAKINDDGTAIEYELTYRDLSSPPVQSHIHFGRPGLSGMVVLFLCTNGTPPTGVPTPQTCPAAPATITGTLTAADVIPRPAQGIDAGAAGLAEMLEAFEAGAAYANVHTTTYPSGEIRGLLRRH